MLWRDLEILNKLLIPDLYYGDNSYILVIYCSLILLGYRMMWVFFTVFTFIAKYKFCLGSVYFAAKMAAAKGLVERK